MADVNQIEVNGVVYDVYDAIAQNSISDFNDWCAKYLTEHVSAQTTSSQHGRIALETSLSLGTGGWPSKPSYALNIWADTGNIRYDQYDHSTSTTTTLGYVPLSSYSTRNSYDYTTTTSSIISFSSGWTVDGNAYAIRWGNVVTIILPQKYSSTISVPADGRLSSKIQIGTLTTEYRPNQTAYMHSWGDNAGQAWGYVDSTGKVYVTAFEGLGGSTRTISANTRVTLCSTYILPVTNNF